VCFVEMPSQALALALAASIYPPAVAAVIALGRGAHVRPIRGSSADQVDEAFDGQVGADSGGHDDR
jgi:hypothetical protein